MHKAYIGIGSNLENPRQQIAQAIKALQLIAEDGKINCSSIYQSTAMTNQECTAQITKQQDYLNAAVCINTKKSALELLEDLKKIEISQGRERKTERWAARTLDLDLLLFDDQIIDHPCLTVPHYGLTQRNFVIYPLVDLDANLMLPNGTTIRELYQACSSTGIQKIE